MGLFEKKRAEENQQPVAEKIERLPTAEELKMSPMGEFSKASSDDFEEETEEKVKGEKQVGSPPLFIKLEKYEEILNTMTEMKNILNSLKNSFFILNENDKIRSETIEIIKEGIERMEQRTAALDSVLLKPPGYEEMPAGEEEKTDEMRDVLSTLRLQIDQLKQELESIE